MAFSDYSLTPAANLTIHGVSIAEGCPAQNINDAIRYLMADARAFNDNAGSSNNLMPKSGGAFTGPITRSSAGAFVYWAASSLTGGAMYVQPSTQALPTSPAEGTIVLQY